MTEPEKSCRTLTKRAFISGITGQDGSFLAALLFSKGYEVHGLVRRTSGDSLERLRICEGLFPQLHLHSGDMLDFQSLLEAIKKADPHEVYNLAAQSFVAASFGQKVYTSEVNSIGTLNLLEAIRFINPRIKFYQASTSEMFGVSAPPQNEDTPFRPRSPYGIAKLAAHWTTVNFRESYGMFCCCGILFNHESARRGKEFVTRKITDAVAQIKYGLLKKLHLGNVQSKRDWGYAPDYVKAMWMMLQQDKPDDYVIATGEQHSVEDFCRIAFARADLDWKEYVELDMSLMRPADVVDLRGDASKAKKVLGWEPETSFEQLISFMVAEDMNRHGNP